ncbi:hypothetical protein ON010_g12472 [Phytophthora cinnamomi]|nr:hypothetical protein ON010_g12472 [Phytophthora cinnamomi]
MPYLDEEDEQQRAIKVHFEQGSGLDDLDAQGYSVKAGTIKMWQGERDLNTIISGVDADSAIILQRILLHTLDIEKQLNEIIAKGDIEDDEDAAADAQNKQQYPPRRVSMIKTHSSRSAGSKRASAISPVFRSSSPVVLYGGRQDMNRFGNRSNNSVHPIAPVVKSLVPRPTTADCESGPTPTSGPRTDTALNSEDYVVRVRVLHGIDLYIPGKVPSCQHNGHPAVNIAVNGSPMQSSTAAQHARNHSIWKKHELKFQVSAAYQNPPTAEEMGIPSCFISMYVSLYHTACSCTKKNEKVPSSLAIGEVGELQLPLGSEGYEISRFFPVIRRQQQSSQSARVLLPAGKIKLRIRVEKRTADCTVVQPEIPKRPPFALPTNFGEALQLKRKQLRATVVPEDNSQKMSSQQLSHVATEAAVELLKEINSETAPDHIDASDLKVEGRVGEGIHSCVSLGVLHRGDNDSDRQVAVKEFRHQHSTPPVSVLRAFRHEYRILERCRRQNGHHHVVELLGVTLEPRLIILMEYFNHGSLAKCLQDEATWGRISIKQKALLGLEIAQGIAWLHKHGMIHRDIKTHNILINGDLATPRSSLKIGDLGSAVAWQQQEPLLLEEVGSSGYTAPEVFAHHGYDNKVDVWSFGIVLWELASSCPQDRINPFTGMEGGEFVSKVQGGCRPKFVHAHQIRFKPVVEKCWIVNPLQRPEMDEVVKQLEKLCAEL